MRDCVFIQTNDRQMLGAIVSEHSIRRNSTHSDRFDIRILRQEDHDFLRHREGQPYLRDGASWVWRNDDLQSFTPLRFMPPELMGYAGRAVVIDPDVFAIGDIHELLARDMRGAALMCREPAPTGRGKAPEGCLPSSVMLLDCARLTHWRCEQRVEAMFAFELDYTDWICLKLEDRSTIGFFEGCWNDFDRLTATTRLLHNTTRRTQPWKTGLPIDFVAATKPRRKDGSPLRRWIAGVRRSAFGERTKERRYQPHPDPNQERLFFGLLRECLEAGVVSEDFLRAEMRRNHLRHDAFEVLDRTRPLAA